MVSRHQHTADHQRIVHALQLIWVPESALPIQDDTTLVFRIGAAYYGIPAGVVYDSQPLHTYTPLPFAQPGITGVVSIGGRLLVIIDVRALFAHAYSPPPRNAHVLLVRLDGVDTGLLSEQIIKPVQGPLRVSAL